MWEAGGPPGIVQWTVDEGPQMPTANRYKVPNRLALIPLWRPLPAPQPRSRCSIWYPLSGQSQSPRPRPDGYSWMALYSQQA